MTAAPHIHLKPHHRASLLPLAELLLKWNSAHNLVSRQLSQSQLVDLLWEATAFDRLLPKGSVIADLGSGAGIPALPLAIIRPDLQIEAIEPRAKRCTWLRYASQELQCPIRVTQKRWDPTWHHFDFVISRAVFQPHEFCKAVGLLAQRSLQMTGAPETQDERTMFHVYRDEDFVGVILAGWKTNHDPTEQAP